MMAAAAISAATVGVVLRTVMYIGGGCAVNDGDRRGGWNLDTDTFGLNGGGTRGAASKDSGGSRESVESSSLGMGNRASDVGATWLVPVVVACDGHEMSGSWIDKGSGQDGGDNVFGAKGSDPASALDGVPVDDPPPNNATALAGGVKDRRPDGGNIE